MTEYPFNQTDAGRAGSRRPRQKNDCAVRALAATSGLSYDEAYDMLARAGRKCGRGFFLLEWIRENDPLPRWTFIYHSFPARRGMRRMNPVEFAERFDRGRFICRMAGHVVACINGVFYDTGPIRPDGCIYGAIELIRRD